MSLPGQSTGELKQHKPMEVTHIPMIEPKLKQELKELINEVLDERNEKMHRDANDDSWLYRGTY